MKRISTLTVSLLFTAVFAVAAFGQIQPASKIGWIDTGAFADEKEGVIKYMNALKALDAEMKPQVLYLQSIQKKIQDIANELNKPAPAGVPVDPKAIQAKQDEGQRLQREGEFKKKEYDATLEKRSGELLGPVSNDISKAIQDFAKQKGYTAILDIDKLGQAGVILMLDPAANITKEFITYYNTRPATTATTAVPK
ncbi:MAG: OmpH family outer membrane protein [Pyrinomonadaceae bacterium]